MGRLGRVGPAFAALMWRYFIKRADAAFPPDPEESVFGHDPHWSPGESAVPESLVKDTDSVAVFLRDSSLSFVRNSAQPYPGKRWIRTGLLKVVFAAVRFSFLAIPATRSLRAVIQTASIDFSSPKACY